MTGSKNREWEKIRRDKLNENFKELSKLLPNYDPSIATSKSEILQSAAKYIHELQEKVKEMGVADGNPKSTRGDTKKLYERIKNLLQRNEQLSTILQETGIKLPKGYHPRCLKRFKQRLSFSNKVTELQAKELSKRELDAQKENQHENVTKRKKVTRSKAKNEERKKAFLLPKTNCTTSQDVANISMVISTTTISLCNASTPEKIANVSTAAVINKSKATTVVISSTSSVPRVSSKIQQPLLKPKINTNLHSLGPGTIILPNGNFVRLLPQPPPIIIKPPTLPQKNLVILTTSTTKSVTTIGPKTRTFNNATQVEKILIPPAVSDRPKNKRKFRKPYSVKMLRMKRTKPNRKVVKRVETKACETKVVDVDAGDKPSDVLPASEPLLITASDTIEEPVNKTVDPVETIVEVKIPTPPVSITSEIKETQLEEPKRPNDHLELVNINSELSNDIFSSLQVPIGGQNPESTSPTAAFLLAFPLVSSLTGVKVAEVIEEENSSSHTGTPTLLQIGTIDTPKTTQTESLTPNLLNLDNFSFFSGYASFEYPGTTTTTVAESTPPVTTKTNFNCAQETTSVTYSTVGTVSTPFQCENQRNQIVHTTTTVNTFSDFSKPTNTYPSNFVKSYADPMYANSAQCNYNQYNYNNSHYYLTKPSSTSYQRYNYYSTAKTTQTKDKFTPPKNKIQSKPPINWMTTPDFRGNTADYIPPPVPTFTKELEYNNTFYPSAPVVSTHTNYFNNTNVDFQQNMQFEENQFSWSPSKFPQYLDTPHNFVSTSLPTLIGDLALGNTQTDQTPKTNKDRKQRVNPNYDTNASNFLSVSQLVEHKPDRLARRTRSVKTNPKGKKLESPKDITDDKKQNMYLNWMDSCNKPLRHSNKNVQSSYSAEALIGHQDVPENPSNRQRYRQNFTAPPNKTLPIPTFLSDNIVPPYFPPVEITQENFMQNQNYQNFTQNASTYLPDFTHDFTNKQNSDCSLKKKHKPTNENLSMDFGFLSMPSAINSPILPDDFHAHTNFLTTPAAPNQIYSCKNPLYSKQSELLPIPPPAPGKNTQQYESIPGSSLTSFNLSAIFPEINKGSGVYSSEPSRNKHYNFHYSSSSVQETFHNKATVSTSSYINTTATTFAPSN